MYVGRGEVSLVCRLGLAMTALMGSAAMAAPVQLKVEQRTNPLGIDEARPTFSWRENSTQRDWKQVAYRIRVATAPGRLKDGKADVWDSAKVQSSESVGIPFSGPELKSRQRYYWSVEVWDAKGHSERSAAPGSWEMGLLSQDDWSATWIYRDDSENVKELRDAKVIRLSLA